MDVQVGDNVRAGQVLARQDTSTLQAAVDSANSTLADAKQQLEAGMGLRTLIHMDEPDHLKYRLLTRHRIPPSSSANWWGRR